MLEITGSGTIGFVSQHNEKIELVFDRKYPGHELLEKLVYPSKQSNIQTCQSINIDEISYLAFHCSLQRSIFRQTFEIHQTERKKS